MPQFSYEAVTKQNEIRRGVLDMDSAEDVAALLRETGLYAYSIRRKGTGCFRREGDGRETADLAQLSNVLRKRYNGPPIPFHSARRSSNTVLSKALKTLLPTYREA